VYRSQLQIGCGFKVDHDVFSFSFVSLGIYR
jgi:hypothetical protein